MTRNLSNLIFLDFEASSLSEYSWPIEIGMAWITLEHAVESAAMLIQPRREWPMSDWSKASEAIHSIPLQSLLKEGVDAAKVGKWFLERSEGKSVISDNPAYEAMWLRRVMKTLTREPHINVVDFDALAHVMFDGPARDAARQWLRETKAPHRAGPDAARLATAFLAGVKTQYQPGAGRQADA